MLREKVIVLLPMRYNDGTEVAPSVLVAILAEIDTAFGGHACAGVVTGTYRMEDGTFAVDDCQEIWIAVSPGEIDELRRIIKKAARTLGQETIYFERSKATVEFLEPDLLTGL